MDRFSFAASARDACSAPLFSSAEPTSARVPPGVAKAIIDAARDERLVFVAHDLTSFARWCVLRGVMDPVIGQDPGREARSAIRVLLSLAHNEPIFAEQEKIRIDIVMRDNLP